MLFINACFLILLKGKERNRRVHFWKTYKSGTTHVWLKLLFFFLSQVEPHFSRNNKLNHISRECNRKDCKRREDDKKDTNVGQENCNFVCVVNGSGVFVTILTAIRGNQKQNQRNKKNISRLTEKKYTCGVKPNE